MKDQPKSDRPLWLAVGLVFGLMLLAWVAAFMVASRAHIADAPIAAPVRHVP